MKKEQSIFRVRFADEIVAEVLLPERQTGKVAVMAIGVPASPVRNETLRFLARDGYVAVFPRYRGTWESDGYFLEQSPAQDIRDVVLELASKKFVTDIATDTVVPLKVSTVHLFGSSFGGPAVLLNTDIPIVKKVIALAPVIDWTAEGEDEPVDEFIRYTTLGFGGAYRLKQAKNWDRLTQKGFYDPLAHMEDIDGKKVFIIHTKDDRNVPCYPVVPFVEKIGAQYYLKPTGGHRIQMTHQFLWKKIEAFLNAK